MPQNTYFIKSEQLFSIFIDICTAIQNQHSLKYMNQFEKFKLV